MFMTASELHEGTRYGDANPSQSNDSLVAEKQGQNLTPGYGLAADVEKHGVQKPVYLDHYPEAFGGKPYLVQGHHRVAAAYYHDPDSYVPVEHYDENHAPPSNSINDQGRGTWNHFERTNGR